MTLSRAALPLLAVVLPLALLPLSCRERTPFSYDFEREEVLDELGWNCRTLFRISPEHATSGTKSLEVSFHPTGPSERESYPGLTLAGFDPDWTAGQALVFDAYNPGDTELELTLRIDDRPSPPHAERVNRHILVFPGPNRIPVRLDELRTSGSQRPLDLRSILRVSLFVANPAERRTLHLDRMRVE